MKPKPWGVSMTMKEWMLALPRSILSTAGLKPTISAPLTELMSQTLPVPLPGSCCVSSSVICPTAVASAMVAPVAPERVSEKVSAASTAVSPLTTTCTILEVSPAAKVSVPVRTA